MMQFFYNFFSKVKKFFSFKFLYTDEPDDNTNTLCMHKYLMLDTNDPLYRQNSA